MVETRNCPVCGIKIEGRSDKKFCSKSCKFKNWKANNRERHNDLMKQVYQRNKNKFKTRQKTLREIGIPDGLLCQDCHKELATERHHLDYSNPMDIDFLCKGCHEKRPNDKPNDLNII